MRDGDRLGFPVFPLEWKDPKTGEISSGYRESGYLPEAVINFLALLGWNPGNDQEILSMDELISLFSFEHCSKSGAKFDFEKGKWFNHIFLQELSDTDLAKLYMPILSEHGHADADGIGAGRKTGFKSAGVALSTAGIGSRQSDLSDQNRQHSKACRLSFTVHATLRRPTLRNEARLRRADLVGKTYDAFCRDIGDGGGTFRGLRRAILTQSENVALVA